MIKAILIDDEPLARSIIKEYLSAHPHISVSAECNDGFEGVKAIMQHQPDLIFLDIQMPRINGFEMLELLEKMPGVIFTTAFDEYAIKAFETHAIDYLLKPFSQERFDKAIGKYTNQASVSKETEKQTQALVESAVHQTDQQHRVVIRDQNQIRIIPVNDIHYIEAQGDYVKIQTDDASYLKKKTMQYFEDTLDPQLFVRVHRSYIIQMAQIVRIDPYDKESYTAVLKSGIQIPLSRNGYTRLKTTLGI